MAKRVNTEEVQRMVEAGAQIVDVLPASTYLEEHIPGAINIPMAEIASAVDKLDKNRPVIVYCYDHQCDLSSRAAARLEEMGFAHVSDYVDSKVAWFADGLPSEGLVDDSKRAISRLHTDVPTVSPAATTAELKPYVQEWEAAAVTNEDGIVLGLVRLEAAQRAGDREVVSVMQPAPPTVRPSIPLRELVETMDKNGERFLLVTDVHGRLMGMVRRSELGAA